MNHASGLSSLIYDICLWCLEGTEASMSIYIGEQSPCLSPLKRELSFLIYTYLGLQSLTTYLWTISLSAVT